MSRASLRRAPLRRTVRSRGSRSHAQAAQGSTWVKEVRRL
jgi:hypothetical protein